MKNLQTALREGDPLAGEPELPAADVDRIRHVLREAGPYAPRRRWTGSLFLVATGALTTAGIVLAVGGRPSGDGLARPEIVAASGVQTPGEPSTRQLQFSTTGGTRIIWVFDPSFEVR